MSTKLATIYFTTKLKQEDMYLGVISMNYIPRRSNPGLVILYENGPYLGVPVQYVFMEGKYIKEELLNQLILEPTLIESKYDWPDNRWFMEGCCYKVDIYDKIEDDPSKCCYYDNYKIPLNKLKKYIIYHSKEKLKKHNQERLPIKLDYSKKIGDVYLNTHSPELLKNGVIGKELYEYSTEKLVIVTNASYSGSVIDYHTLNHSYTENDLLGKIISDPIEVVFKEDCPDECFTRHCYKAEVWDVKTEIDDLIKDKIHKTIDSYIASFYDYSYHAPEGIGYKIKEKKYYTEISRKKGWEEKDKIGRWSY